jgi:ectoine hydroxylase
VLNDEVPKTLRRAAARNTWREKWKGRSVRTNFAAHTYNDAYRRLARHPRLIEPAQQVLDDDVYIHQFKINGKAAFDGDVWQWHQDYGTWYNDDDMPQPRAMNIAVYLEEVNEFNGPLMFIPRSHQEGRQEAGHDVTTTSYPLWTIDNATITRLVAAGGHRRAQRPRRVDADVPLQSRACLGQQHDAVESDDRLPEHQFVPEPHPALQAAGLHRPPRFRPDQMPA